MTSIDDKIRERIAKVQALVNGGIDGEKQAAKVQLDKLLKKYNINPAQVDEITKKQYHFKYATELDKSLFSQLLNYFFKDIEFQVYLHTGNKKELSVRLDYLDYITISCSYEYFKRHMNQEWKKFSEESLKRKRTNKTKNKLRADLQDIFFSQYIIKSRIYHPEQVRNRQFGEMSKTELDHYRNLQQIQGGQYHAQVEKETLKIG
ncbi:hypothetical protein RG089_000598 [Elizabethkingia anophelis]|nr:hypothetical protein [Elizabethkingia anophelis]ELB1892030.1 hypothetical protein [Elizabethkingia anophelis]